MLKRNKIFLRDHYIFSFIFLVLGIIGILHHEFWLDEAHHWLLSRDSTSISNLITNTRYQGHPILWNLLLFFITRFSLNPFWMQLLHVVIATSVIFVFLRKAPFSRLFKILFIFGYLMLYEYTVVSRNYMLGILPLFLACSLYPNRKEKFVLLATFLALASNVHAIWLVISASFFLMLILENILNKQGKLPHKMWLGILIFTLGALLAVIQIIPPSDTLYFDKHEHSTVLERIAPGLISFYRGIVLLPDFRTLSFWNTNILVNISRPLAAFIAAIALIIPYILFNKNRLRLLYVYLGIFGVGLFFYITDVVGTRFDGMLFILFITALWIDHYDPVIQQKTKKVHRLISSEKLKKGIIYSILAIHLFSGIMAYAVDFQTPFTNAKQVVSFLEESALDSKFIATKGCGGTPISAYLQKPIYSLSLAGYYSFCPSNTGKIQLQFDDEDTIDALKGLLQSKSGSIIYIATWQPFLGMTTIAPGKSIHRDLKVRLLKEFETSIRNKGKYYIYEVAHE